MNAADDDEETLLFHLVYYSRASAELSSGEVDRIISTARPHNAERHITGWLVYSSGIFFQWLEGTREHVLRLMAAIRRDKRHTNVVILSEAEEVRARLFADWDMEWVSPEDIRAVLFDAIGAANDPKSDAALRLLLKELDSKAVGAGN